MIKVPQEREDAPQSSEETVELVKLVSQERVQQWSAEQMVEWPQSPGETVDAVMLDPREARLREQFQQLLDLHHTRKLLVNEMRELVAGLGSDWAC